MAIRGISIKLVNLVETSRDKLNQPVYTEKSITVDNVLIAPTSSSEILEIINLTGKKAVYTLAIPKGDNNIWEDQIVEFFGKRFRVFGSTLEGMSNMIPLKWNKKVMVERYE